MLAYAASRPATVEKRPHPNTLLFIIGAHVAAVALVMSARMDLPKRVRERPLQIDLLRIPPDPTPIQPKTQPAIPAPQPKASQPVPQVSLPAVVPPAAEPQLPSAIPAGGLTEGGATVIPEVPKPALPGMTSGAQLVTPEGERKPPYPASKLLNEEEAVLTLRLTIDERGRVTAVDPVGRSDPAFLESARRHLMAHWRYKPAMEAGRAIASTMVIRLHFELDG